MEIEIVEKNKLSTYNKMADFFNKEMKKKRFCNYPPNLHFACSGRRGHRAWAKIDGEKCSPETKAQKLIFYIDFPSAMQRKIGENILYIVCTAFYIVAYDRGHHNEGVATKDEEYYVFTRFSYYYFVLLSG